MVVMGPAAMVVVTTPAPGMGRRRGGAEGDRAQDEKRNNNSLHGTLPHVCGRGAGDFSRGAHPRFLINAELAERSQNILEPFVIAKFTGVWTGLL
jgi:hypothetical protein